MPKVIDLFAGAGGFGLGFHMADYQIACSIEKDQWAADTLKHNNISGSIIQSDIRRYQTDKDILNCCNVCPDIIIGGPPCQGFSQAGSASKKDPNDPRNSLFLEFANWVRFFKPKIFVMENVTGILTRKNANGDLVIDIIKQIFQDLGYTINIWKLNALEYGVPQTRRRIFIVGNNLGMEINNPPKTHSNQAPSQTGTIKLSKGALSPAITVNNALSDLPVLKARQGEEEQAYTFLPRSDYQVWARGSQQILFNHVAMHHTDRIVERFKRIQSGVHLVNLPEELKVRQRNGDGELSKTKYDSNYRHLLPNEVSYTIPASFYSSFIHPTQPRNITAREAARIQSFPDWYRFMGKRTVVSSKLLKKFGRENEDNLSQYNQIGNAVPPLLAKAIAMHLKTYL